MQYDIYICNKINIKSLVSTCLDAKFRLPYIIQKIILLKYNSL